MRRRLLFGFVVVACLWYPGPGAAQTAPGFDLVALERPRILAAAETFLSEAPVTVTASRSPRSAGGAHDFFSEGDYWWPDPANPDGPYIQRDGQTNPSNFVEHRRAMVRIPPSPPSQRTENKRVSRSKILNVPAHPFSPPPSHCQTLEIRPVSATTGPLPPTWRRPFRAMCGPTRRMASCLVHHARACRRARAHIVGALHVQCPEA